MSELDDEHWKTARHEAGHAVAAVHYDCAMDYVSVAARWPALGTTRLGVSRPQDAVPLLCGPLAEKAWDEFRPGAFVSVQTVGSDHEAIEYLRLNARQRAASMREALVFISRVEVQEQIDRVAQALLARGQLSREEVIDAAGFTVSLASQDWLES